MERRPPIIGLAGGIASGKSAVASILAEMGCAVFDADHAAREVLRQPEVRAQLVSWWGEGVIGEGGEVDRRAVAAIVFDDPEARRRLEALTHPLIEARRREAVAAAPPEAPAIVIDAPLLFEVGLDRACDAVIFVDAPRDRRLARAQRSRGWDEAEFTRREESQLPLDVKRSAADHVIENDGDLDGLTDQVREILRQIVSSGPRLREPSSRPGSGRGERGESRRRRSNPGDPS
jgi:dephospho-CoA kinase